MKAYWVITAPLIGLALFLSGCTTTSGTITEKEYEAAKYKYRVCETKSVTKKYTDRATGKTKTKKVPKTTCKDVPKGTLGAVPYMDKKPCWELEIEHDTDICVREDEWNSVEVEDEWR